MGLAELFLGAENPVAKWSAGNQNLLGALSAGLAQGPDFGQGVARALTYAPKAKMLDVQAAEAIKEKERETAQNNAFKDWLTKTRPDLAPLMDAGVDQNTLFTQALKQPETPDLPNDYEIFQLAQKDPAFAEYLKGQGAAGGDQPASVKEYQFAVSQGYGKDYQTFIQEKGRNAGTPPATIAKEIFEADEGAQAGQNVIAALDKALEINATAWDGPLADLGSSTTALLGKKDDPTTLAAVQTQELKNLVTANALESLKATFGAAPTEGERKILLEVQGSINQPRAVREAIFKRAKAAAERRLKFNQERGSALRGGGYFDPGYSPVAGGDTGVYTVLGVE
jgi:hypothetical protein